MNRTHTVIGPRHLAIRWAFPTLFIAVFSATVTAKTPAHLQLPEVHGPIAVTASSRPFLSAGADVEAAGYVQEEYFLSGNANVYDWTGKGLQVKTIAGPGKYTNRILVRRPRDAQKFSGNVDVEILNASNGTDYAGTLGAFSDLMMRRGDVWIGITSKPIVVKALQKFDPQRYAALDWSNPAPAASRCAEPTIIPAYQLGGVAREQAYKSSPTRSMTETEDGLAWDIIGQLGMLLKSERRAQILPGFSPPSVFLIGISQSGMYLRTWASVFHNRYRLPSGKPIYDGYFNVVMAVMSRINQCSQDIEPNDPRNRIVPPDVPFISLLSEGEMWLGARTRQPDTVKPRSGFVTYEVAGGSHGWGTIPGTSFGVGQASPEDIAKAGIDLSFFARLMPPKDLIRNDFVWVPVMRTALLNLQLWAREGVLPPQAPPLKLDASLDIQRDRYGNALGGLRLPDIDVPTSGHLGAIGHTGMGQIIGSRTPFSAETLKALYPDHETYVAQFSAATDRMVAERWILPDDAQAMKKAAQAAKVPE